MDKALRNTLRNVVTQCRKLLEDSIADTLEGQYGVYRSGKTDPDSAMVHLTPDDHEVRGRILIHLRHIRSSGFKDTDAVEQLTREVAYTHLNRFSAYKMMEKRGLIREAVSRGTRSQGYSFYLADHPDDEALHDGGKQDVAYRHFLTWQGAQFSDEIGVLFSPTDLANALFPPQRVLDEVLVRINSDELQDIWEEDEAIGWIYQYFTPKELRDQARKESQAPRNSYELSFRNQFYTPRYVVEFLTDNTLGRIWYEMLKGDTRLTEQCRYLVRRPDEVFLAPLDDDSDDAQFLLGKLESIPPFEEPVETFNASEPVPNSPNTFTMAHYSSDAAGYRLRTFAHFNRPFDWNHDPRFEGWQTLLANLASGEAQEPVEGKTQDLWDCLLAVTRADRFNDGIFAEHSHALTRIGNEIARRIADSRRSDLSQEDLLRSPVLIPDRPYKDPRRLRILDPACGSGHFLLYAFDLLAAIYEEAWERDLRDPNAGSLRDDYPTLDALRQDIPRLILANNLHGIDIDARATQIAALALWLRAQRYYQAIGMGRGDERPKITRGNIVCAEPMPGDETLLDEFCADLQPKLLGQLVRAVFNKMKLAGEAGSLLKIEEELQDAIEAAKKQYAIEQAAGSDMQTRALFPDLFPPQPTQLKMFDLSGIDDATFFEQAERRVLDALHAYARQVTNGKGLQRQLFADDAAQGFAFIDVCRKHYDVVLMNPPFGDSTAIARRVIDQFWTKGRHNLATAFVDQAKARLNQDGFVGVLMTRTPFYQSRYNEWRESVLTEEDFALCLVADLGQGVLDGAMVEAIAPIFGHYGPVSLAYDHFNLGGEYISPAEFSTDCAIPFSLSSFDAVPNKPLAYWVPSSTLHKFSKFGIYARSGEIKQGLATKDNERFVRTWWEVPVNELNHGRWRPFSKGGEYAKYYLPLVLVVDWAEETQQHYRKREGQMVVLLTGKRDLYLGRSALTYSKRSQIGFSARVLPSGTIFSPNGPGVFPASDEYLFFDLALLNFSFTRACLEFLTSFGFYSEGYVESVIYPTPEQSELQTITEQAEICVEGSRKQFLLDETTRDFTSASLYNVGSLSELHDTGMKHSREYQAMVMTAEDSLERAFATIFALSDEDKQFAKLRAFDSTEKEEFDNFYTQGDMPYSQFLIQLSLGISFGRWDIRYTNGDKPIPKLPDPFAPLPACPPGMLQGEDGLPLTETPPGYPVDIQWDGILVDDEGHPADVVGCTRQVIDLLWGDRADAIEREACEILGVKSLRDYFRKTGKGGFWDDHVKRYSKSRRKAPIYWLLQSSKKNYGLWLYYHRLDKDILFKALVNYVEPKIRLEEARLNDLRSQLAAAGNTGSAAKKLEGEVDKQEALLAELDDFRDKLQRAAQLNLTPDLNDGVVLNIAPLWELVPWKVAQQYWDELLEGKYEWSTISGQLRAQGLVT